MKYFYAFFLYVIFKIKNMNYLVIFIGAGIGGSLRYFLSGFFYKILPALFPFGTLAVNVLGSFALGIIIFGLDERDLISPLLKLFLGVGFCGGFTTFSTFSLETFNLIRDSEFLLAASNVFLNVIVSFAGIYIGYLVSRV
jgi:fluoride exporter